MLLLFQDVIFFKLAKIVQVLLICKKRRYKIGEGNPNIVLQSSIIFLNIYPYHLERIVEAHSL